MLNLSLVNVNHILQQVAEKDILRESNQSTKTDGPKIDQVEIGLKFQIAGYMVRMCNKTWAILT